MRASRFVTLGLQRAVRPHLKLVLPTHRNFLPLIDHLGIDVQERSERLDAPEMRDCLFDGHHFSSVVENNACNLALHRIDYNPYRNRIGRRRENRSEVMAFDLASISRNKGKPPIVAIHGGPGIGKTTFGCCAPDPIVLRTEDGLGGMDVQSFPIATSFDDVLEAIGTLYGEEHDFKSLVIDSLDWLEPLIWDHVCNNWTDKKGVSKRLTCIEDAGYGKG
jgi:hypothetical protein